MNKYVIGVLICLIARTGATQSLIANDNQFNLRGEFSATLRSDSFFLPIDSVVTIPVVFHIVYHTAQQNISDSLILNQLNFTNLDFRNQNPDTVNVPDAFKPFAGDSKIQFSLAQCDPFGNSTNGITRTYTDSAQFILSYAWFPHFKYDSTGGKSAWDTYRYLNIWVTTFGGLGFSAFANGTLGGSVGMPWDGISMNYGLINNSHVLSHEIGHYFDLWHLWNYCNPDTGYIDYVFDTPNQYGPSSGCPSFPLMDTCTSTFPGIMFMNYMDYSSSSCKGLFTHGQAERMRSSLSNYRLELLSTNGGCPLLDGDQNGKSSLNLYPNPANDLVHYQLPEPATCITAYDVLSRAYQLESSSTKSLDIHNLSPGIYTIEFITRNNRHTQRFVKM